MFESTPKRWQILRERAVLADLGPASGAMEITAGTDQQTELTRQNGQAADLLGRLMPVDHFDSVTTCLNIVANQAPAFAAGEIVVPWMGQADPGTRGAQGSDGFLEGRPVLLDVPSLPAPSHLRNASARSLT